MDVDFEFLDHDQIENITLRTGIIEKIQSRCIFISSQLEANDSEEAPYGLIFQHVEIPETTYKAIQRVIRDIPYRLGIPQ